MEFIYDIGPCEGILVSDSGKVKGIGFDVFSSCSQAKGISSDDCHLGIAHRRLGRPMESSSSVQSVGFYPPLLEKAMEFVFFLRSEVPPPLQVTGMVSSFSARFGASLRSLAREMVFVCGVQSSPQP